MSTVRPPAKPYEGFPLFAHQNGQYAKKIRGRMRYFGRVADGWEAALELYQFQRDDLHAGREPQVFNEGLTLPDLWTEFLTDFAKRVQRGKVGQGSYDDHQRTGSLVVNSMGRNVLISSLRKNDWKRLRDHWEERYAPSTIAGHVARVKAVFAWAYEDEELIDKPMKFGRVFRRPEEVEFRRHRERSGEKLLSALEIRQLLSVATPQMRCCIMLGLNLALNNKDCGLLEFRHLDLDSGWIIYPRNKTHCRRKGKLWPETIAAIHDYLPTRRRPKDPALNERVLLTRTGGPMAFEDKRDSPIAKQFAKLRTKAGLPDASSFGALRHTFRSVAEDDPNKVPTAIHCVMGHADTSIDAAYIEYIGNDGLIHTADRVRRWFLSDHTQTGVAGRFGT